MAFSILPLLLLISFLPSAITFYNYILPDCQFDHMWFSQAVMQLPIQSRCQRWTFPPQYRIYRRVALQNLNPFWPDDQQITAGLLNSENNQISIFISMNRQRIELVSPFRITIFWSFNLIDNNNQRLSNVPQDKATVTVEFEGGSKRLFSLSRHSLVSGQVWERVHYASTVMALDKEVVSSCFSLKIKGQFMEHSCGLLIGEVRVEAIAHALSRDNWLYNSQFEQPSFRISSKLFYELVPHWLGTFIIERQGPKHVCILPLDPAKYIQQPFAVIQGWYRIGLEWEDVEHIQSHEYQTINVLLDDQIIMTIDINKATLARQRQKLVPRRLPQGQRRTFYESVIKNLWHSVLLLREYDIYRLKIVTVNSSGRQLFKIVKVDVRRVRRPPQPPQRGSSLPQRLRIVMSDEGSSSQTGLLGQAAGGASAP